MDLGEWADELAPATPAPMTNTPSTTALGAPRNLDSLFWGEIIGTRFLTRREGYRDIAIFHVDHVDAIGTG